MLILVNGCVTNDSLSTLGSSLLNCLFGKIDVKMMTVWMMIILFYSFINSQNI